jgi:drug/metabolite transporter (DMT)-like permease
MMVYIGILCMTLMGAIASIFLKKASGSDSIWKMLLNFNLYVGGVLYLASAVLNIIVLRYMEYSVVLPLTSFTYVWTMILAAAMLNEKIGMKKIAGVVCIIAGAICVAV